MPEKTWRISRANLDDLKIIRRYIRDWTTALDIDDSIAYDLMMAATEVTTNIIVHGYHGQPGPIEIGMRNDENDIVIDFLDQAAPYDPGSASSPNVTLPLEQRSPGGLGIYLMKDCMDQIVHETLPHGGNKLTLIKRNVIRTPDKLL